MTVMRNGSSRGSNPSNALADTVSDNLQGAHGANVSMCQLQPTEGTSILLSGDNVNIEACAIRKVPATGTREVRDEHARWVDCPGA